MAIITPRSLSMILYQDPDAIDPQDRSCLFMLGLCEELVRTTAGFGMEDEIPAARLVDVRAVLLNLAGRVWTNPQVVSRRAVGPLSRSFFEEHATGLALRPDEVERLQAGKVGSSTGDLWALGTHTGRGGTEPSGRVPVQHYGETTARGRTFPLYGG